MSDGALNVLAGVSEFTDDSLHQWGKSFSECSKERQISFLMLLLSQSGSNHEFAWFIHDLKNMLRQGEVQPIVAAYAVLVIDAFGRESNFPQHIFERYLHDETVQSAQRILALRKYAFPGRNQAQKNFEFSPHECETDLNWFRALKDSFLLPLAHSRLQISAIAQAMDGLQISHGFFDALESFSSTGYQHGFILAQLYICQGSIGRGKELIDSLLDMFFESLPEPIPTEQLMQDVNQLLQNGLENPRLLPWAKPRSELYWRLILNGL